MKLIASFCLIMLSAACSSEHKLGESCDVSGKGADECESGAICGKNTSDALVCLKVCTVQTDCAADQDCNGVDGSNVKGCRTKSSTSGSSGTDAGKK